MVWLLYETSKNLRNFACPWPFFSIFGVFQKRALGNEKVEVLLPNLVRNSNLGILIKIRMVWLLFWTLRNLRNLSCLDTGKMAIFEYFLGYFKKEQ